MKCIITKKEILPILLIAIIFIVSFILYPQLPDKIPSHWNSRGEIDAWSSKNFTVFFYPGLTLGIYLLMLFIPLIDPLRKNYSKFTNIYFGIRTALVSFFILLYLYTLWIASGGELNINYFMIPLISLLFIVLGIFMPKIKKNYFVGIRTPWTIHSEKVWNETHKLAGKLFIGAGLISFAGLFVIDYAIVIFLVAILSAAFGSVIYSYFIFRKIEDF